MRALREEARLTCETVAKALECRPTKIGRIENGRSPVKSLELNAMLDMYGVRDAKIRDVLLRLSKESRQRGWWHSYQQITPLYADLISLEASTVSARNYETTFVPGLLQTADYARALEREAGTTTTEEQVDELVKVRMQRQQTLERADFHLWAVVSEAALRHLMGGGATMRQQLAHLEEQSTRPNVDIQALPLASPAHAMSLSAFVIVAFPELTDREVVYVDNLLGTLYFEREDEVAMYVYIYDRLRAAALPLDDSRALVRGITRDL